MDQTQTEKKERTGGMEHAEGVRSKANELKNEIKEEAREKAAELKEEAREASRQMLDNRIGSASSALGSIARAIRSAARELDDESFTSLARYTRRAADQIDDASESIRHADFDEIVSRAENFARSKTAAFLGVAIAAGFVGVRFLKSSTPRENQPEAGYDPALRASREYDRSGEDERFGRGAPYGGAPGKTRTPNEQFGSGTREGSAGDPSGRPSSASSATGLEKEDER